MQYFDGDVIALFKLQKPWNSIITIDRSLPSLFNRWSIRAWFHLRSDESVVTTGGNGPKILSSYWFQ